MDQPVISVNHVGMSFRCDVNKTTSLKEWFIRAAKHQNRYENFEALKDISFDVMEKEVVGLVGKNGAGKSTLLKIISGILPPTKGSVAVQGQIVPLLELGSGFDVELSGIDNIFLNGAVLGYSQDFMISKFQEIVDFADIEDFIRQPLKTYSSGMLARLAFSIATVVNPDVLIVDELLAVGDEQFQRKSYKRMMELMQGGATVLFVSHDIKQVRQICSRVIWMDHGRVVMSGDTDAVCDAYQASFNDQEKTK